MERPRLFAAHLDFLHRLISQPGYNPFSNCADPINKRFGTNFTYYDVDRAISYVSSYYRQNLTVLFALDSESRHYLHHLYYVERIKEAPYLLHIMNQKFAKRLQPYDMERELRVMTEFANSHPKGYLTRKEYVERSVKEQEHHSGFWKKGSAVFRYPKESSEDQELSKVLGDWELPHMQRDLSDDKPIEVRLGEILNAVGTQPPAEYEHSWQSLDYVRHAEGMEDLQPKQSSTSTQSVLGSSIRQQSQQRSSTLTQPLVGPSISQQSSNPKVCHASRSPLLNIPSAATHTDRSTRKRSSTDDSTTTEASSSWSPQSRVTMYESPPGVHPTSQQSITSPLEQPSKKLRLDLQPVQKVTNTNMTATSSTGIYRIAGQATSMERRHGQGNSQQPMTNKQTIPMARCQTHPMASLSSTQPMQRGSSTPNIGASKSMAQASVIDLTGSDDEQHLAHGQNHIGRACEPSNSCSPTVPLPLPNDQFLTVPLSQPLSTTRKSDSGQDQADNHSQTYANIQPMYGSPIVFNSAYSTAGNSGSIVTQPELSMENVRKGFSPDYVVVDGRNGTGTGTFINPTQFGSFATNNGTGNSAGISQRRMSGTTHTAGNLDNISQCVNSRSHSSNGNFGGLAQSGMLRAENPLINYGTPNQNQSAPMIVLHRPPLQSPRPIDQNSMIGTPVSQTVPSCLTRPVFNTTRPRPAPPSRQQSVSQQQNNSQQQDLSQQQNLVQQRNPVQQRNHVKQRNTVQQQSLVPQQKPRQHQVINQQPSSSQKEAPRTFRGKDPETPMERMQYIIAMDQNVSAPQPQQPTPFPTRQVPQSYGMQMQQEHIYVPYPTQNMHYSFQQEDQRQVTPRPYFSGLQGAQGFQGIQDNQWAQGIQGLQGAQDNQWAQGIQGLQGAQANQWAQSIQGLQGAQDNQWAQGIQDYQVGQVRQQTPDNHGTHGNQRTQIGQGMRVCPNTFFQENWSG